jgi:putative peptidoglycan lipid II flippase
MLTSFISAPIVAVAIGVTLGGIMQFVTQVPSFLRSGYTFGIDRNFGHRGLKKMGRLILPSTVGLAVAQINIFVSTILASFLFAGSITYLYYSMRLIQFPVGMFGVAMGMATLPALSEHAARGDMDSLRKDFSFTLRLLFFITVPAMAGLIALRFPIVNLLFQRGEFDYTATQGTAFSLMFYALGIWAMVGVRVVVAAFYAMQDTSTPVKVAVLALSTNILMSLLLMGPLKHGGLALANALSSMVNFSFLFYFLRRRLGRVDGRKIMTSFGKIVTASLTMGIIGWFLLRNSMWTESGQTMSKGFYLGGTISLCIVLYVALAFILKIDELHDALEIFTKKKRRGA